MKVKSLFLPEERLLVQNHNYPDGAAGLELMAGCSSSDKKSD
jgi:hypothetical protein